MEMVLKEYEKRKNEIKQRLDELSATSKERVFEELCFCLMTPQSNAQRCWSSVVALKEKDLLKNGQYEEMLKNMNGCRFHRTKARHIIEARKNFDEIYDVISKAKNSVEVREWLVENVEGYGYKEASHFMRNIGFRDVAILDRHVLRKLVEFGVIEEFPKTLTKNKYMEIEKKFFDFAKSMRIDPAELDLVIWSMNTGFVFK